MINVRTITGKQIYGLKGPDTKARERKLPEYDAGICRTRIRAACAASLLFPALKGQDKRVVHLYCPFRAKNHVSTPKTQGVALGYHTLHLRCGTHYLHPDLKTSGQLPKMRHTRGGYTLMEMMAVIAALVVLMALTVRPMRTLVLDIPRSNRDFQTLTQTMDMLEQLKKDIEQSARMTLIEMDPRISGNLLYLEQPDGLVTYLLADNHVARQSSISNDPAEWNAGIPSTSSGQALPALPQARAGSPRSISGIPADTTWNLPHVRLEWAFWKNGGAPYALEITTWSERIILNKTRDQFKQSHVYFPQTGSSNP